MLNEIECEWWLFMFLMYVCKQIYT
uniref:Uncharacterized protein n=1 Tax=Anguilla anguilla TaxID=7936 RepID=A0A0E9S9A8_ANGAN